ncbi:MAG: exodeoxyribonuclease V subunit beta, partial [Deltaproteobacteria bacterium]
MSTQRCTELDPINCPLEGTNLIEASAGTGKTHTIASLVVRLILEKRCAIGEILVVTFTTAATEELKGRIRSRLVEAWQVFTGQRPGDPFLNALRQKTAPLGAEAALIRAALRQFDEAPIYTIHGFCARVLSDHAFETGRPFDTRLITEEQELYRQLTYDFWRDKFYQAPLELIGYALSQKLSPSYFMRLINSVVTWPALNILPKPFAPELSHLSRFRECFSKMKTHWPIWRNQVKEILMSPALYANVYGSLGPEEGGRSKREELVSLLVGEMDRWMGQEKAIFPPFRRFEKLTARKIRSSVRKGQEIPVHEFFDLADELHESASLLREEMDQYLLSLAVEFMVGTRDRLGLEKQRQNIQTYQDLIMATREALRGRQGKRLISVLRKKFKAALIDEFHDTDSAQYEIFKALFGEASRPLFLIGDPKQAIYGFRGADIFAYLQATREVQKRYNLSTNWRSEPSLLKAVNSLFAPKKRPFVFEEISYIKAAPAQRRKRKDLRIDGTRVPPLQIWYLDSGPVQSGQGPIPKGQARALLARAVGFEVARLINLGRCNRAHLGDEPLKEKHIAVLVRTNDEAILVQRTLQDLNIHTVLYTGENVFDTQEAWEMQQLLSAIAAPENDNILRGALATELFGMTALEFLRLTEDDSAWENTLLRFREYRLLWEREGFMAMFRCLLEQEGIRRRLLGLRGGERKITNLLQLSELLQKVSMEQDLGIHGLVGWLAQQRNPDTPRSQEHQLKLESDEEAVKILTIHKSKGLEFPVVFCPFSWGSSEPKDTQVTFHARGSLVLDIGSEDLEIHRNLAARELLAENIRLLYVAVTRAACACYLAWGYINETESSALAYLLCGPDGFDGTDVVEETRKRFQEAGSRGLKAKLQELAEQSEHSIVVCPPPTKGEKVAPVEEGLETFTLRAFKARVPSEWKVTSFSSLISGHPITAELPDYDQVTLDGDMEGPFAERGEPYGEDSILSFPRGTRAGTFLHKVMEDLDFAQKDRAVHRDLVAKRLEEYGYEEVWLDPVCRMVENVLEAQLDPERPHLRLSGISRSHRLNELEFYLPLGQISPDMLQDLFQEDYAWDDFPDIPECIGRLNFAPCKGFMKG